MFLVLIFAVIIGLANCQKSPRNIETAYSEGKEYLYDYESQVLSGLPEGAKTVAGLKLKSSVVMQIFSQWEVKLQLESPSIYKINNWVDSEDPLKEMLPSEDMDELLDDDAEKMKLHLCKPVTLTYLRGHVRDVKTEEDDPIWSVNIKRGILSLLEMNFNERQTLDKDVPVLMSNSEPKIYRVVEPSAAGECVTRYWVKPERSDDDVPSMKIQKIRDYDKCMEKVIHTLDVLNGRPCHTCDEDWSREHISAQSSVRYELLGSPDQYIIVSAKSDAHYNFVPYSEEAGKLTTISKQALTLLEDGPIHNQINNLRSPVHHERPLKVKTSEDTSTTMSPEKFELMKDEKENIMEMVKKLLTGIEKLLEEKVDEESGELVFELSRLLRKLDKHSWDKLLDEVLRKDMKMPKARKLLMDILPSLGTYASVDVLLERIEKSEIPEDSAAIALMTLSVLPQPDVFIVKRLMDFIKSKDMDEEMRHVLLRRSSWLALGSLGSKMMKVSHSLSKDIEDEHKALEEIRIESNEREIRRKLDVRLEEVKNKGTQTRELYTTEKLRIIDMVKKLLEKEDKDSKLLVIKVMGSLGYEEFLPMLENVLRDEESHDTCKLETVHSLWHVVKSNPEQIEKILLPLCLDEKQHDVVRMMAIEGVLHSEKSESAVEMIVESLEDKPNENVGHYVMSCLEELSKLPAICDEMNSLVRNSSFARRYASKMPSDSRPKSRMIVGADYIEKMKMGHSYKQTIMFSPEETTPSLLKMSYSAVLLGKVSDLFEWKYSGMGMDSVFDELLEDSMDTSLETVLKTILHPRNRRSPEPETEQMIKDIKEKIGVEPLVPKEVDGHVSLHLLGHEIVYMDTDSLFSFGAEPRKVEGRTSMLENLKDKLHLIDTIKNLMETQRSVMLPIVHSTIITETGLPLTLRIDTFGIMKMEGDLKMKPDLEYSRRKSLIGKVDALVKVRPSALFEMRCKMEVDMEHFWSGISVKGRVHLDAPVSLSVNVDPEVSKLMVKVRDEKKMRPLKLNLHTHTVIRRVPWSADKYSWSPEVKEISWIDGTDIKLTFYEIGKDVLGRSLKVVSERSVRKDSLVPFHPFCGKQSLYVEYEPHSDDGLDIQIQHIRDIDERDEGHDRSWYSKFTGWFSSPKESSAEKSEEESSSSDSEEWDDSDKDFLDLEEKDLSMAYLKNKFRKHTDLMESGSKCGLVLHIVDPKLEKEHEVQLSTFYQRDHSRLKTSYTVELKMRTKPEETNVWKLVTDMRLDLPSTNFEPSELLDSQYQKMVMEDIQLSVRQDGKSMDSLLDLGSRFLTRAVRKSKEFESRGKEHNTLEEIINYILEESSDADSVHLEMFIQKVRKLLKDAKEFSQSRDDALKVEQKLKDVGKLLEKSKEINFEVYKKLDETTKGDQDSEDAVMVLYICKKQEDFHWEIKKTVEKMLPLLDREDRKDVELKLDDLESLLKETKDKQMEHSEKKQPTEHEKSKIEVAPVDREFYTTLLIIEKKLIDVLVSKSNLIKDERSQVEMDGKVRLYDVIVQDLKKVKIELDGKLLEKGGLERVLRVKILEIMLYQKLAVFDLENDIRDLDEKAQNDDLENLKTLSDNMIENSKRILIEKKEDLDRKSDEFSERLVLVIESKRKTTTLLPHDEDQMHMMFKVRLDQVNVLEDLRRKWHLEETEEDHEMIREIVDKVKDISKSIKEIMDKAPEDEESEKEHPLHPVFVGCLKARSKQMIILSMVERLVDDRIIKMAVAGDPVLEKCEELRNETEHLKAEMIKELRKMEFVMTLMEDDMLEYEDDDVEPKKHILLTDIQKGIHNVEVKHAELRDLKKELMDKMDSKLVDEKSPERKSQLLKLKKILYNVIDKLQSSQDELEKIHEELGELKQNPDKEELENVIREVMDKVEDQLKCVLSVEKEVADKSKDDESLYVPLQDVQRIKDSTLRLKHSTKVLQTDIQSRSEASSEKDERNPDQGNKELHSWQKKFKEMKKDRSDITGVIQIWYGDEEDKEPKIISIRLFAKKSLEQLLWELDQSIPVKQDKIVQSYLSDRFESDDPTASDYMKIKDRLNSLRHLHVLVAYEDSLPEEVRKVMWELQEVMKLRFSDKVELIMPDKSNMKNKLEVVSEIKADDRWIDVMIKTPTETTKLRNMRTPEMLMKTSLFDSLEVMSHSAIYDSWPLAICEVTPERVKTLKERSIEVNLKSHPCTTVLAMDCSSDSLVVTSKPYLQDPEKKVITILTKERKVEIIPESSKVMVKVDGESVPKPKDKDFIKVSDKFKKHSVMIKYWEDKAEVKIPHDDLTVKSDGRKISIKVPKFYMNKLCGVCGNSDKHGRDELQGPKKVKYSDPQAFVSTYMVPESACDPTPILKELGVPEIRKKSKQVQPEEETFVKEETVDKVRKTCFSIKPGKKCPPGSEPEKEEHRLVSYYCIRSSNSKTRTYLEIVKKRVLDEVRAKRVDKSEYIEMPIVCHKQ